jgi:hypothetical protein
MLPFLFHIIPAGYHSILLQHYLVFQQHNFLNKLYGNKKCPATAIMTVAGLNKNKS